MRGSPRLLNSHWVAQLAVFSICLTLTAQVGAAEFCETWASVYKTAHRGFRPFRGAYDQDMAAYISTLAFPNARSCTIEEDEHIFRFHCTWKYTHTDEHKALTDAQTLSKGVRQCLGTRKMRSRWLDDNDGGDAKGGMLWRDEIADNTDEPLKTSISAYKHAESHLRSGRTFPASIAVSIQIRFYRDDR